MGIKTLLFATPVALLGTSVPFLMTNCPINTNKLESETLNVDAFYKNDVGIWNTVEMEGYNFASFSVSKSYLGFPIINVDVIAAGSIIGPDSYSGNIYFKNYNDAVNLINFASKYDNMHILSNNDYNNLLEGQSITKELAGETNLIANIGGDQINIYHSDDSVSADLQLFILNNFDEVFNKINS